MHNHAIAQYELAYQVGGQGRRWLHRLMLRCLLLMSLALFALLVVGVWLQETLFDLFAALGPWPLLLILPTVFWHFGLMAQTLYRAANSIVREKEGQTWELLLLTGLSQSQVLRAKWWATVKRQLPSYVWLAGLGMGTMSWVAVTQSVAYIYYTSGVYSDLRLSLPTPPEVLLAGLAVVGLTLFNLGLTAACGIVAAVQSRDLVAAISAGLLLRVLVAVLPAVVAIVLGPRIERSLLTLEWQRYLNDALSMGLLALADNGAMLTLYGLLSTGFFWSNGAASVGTTGIPDGFAVLAAVIALALYLLATRGILWLAGSLATRPQLDLKRLRR